ncbi:uncharacterized protein LOC111699809 [Eurytemora carolleeae]|uniref:uncharacterized protein LOC111699809 n=1 Tax=Eurytemora carolleeae TaxID=1294199 RepID=UPI000C76602C|nr:uncharacterized protein LOC111699809 [Eurytemora carolleeae]|eukprot:XP_023326312.1 uncharacterized protein LOC111699809 [Eurytemora affinis]
MSGVKESRSRGRSQLKSRDEEKYPSLQDSGSKVRTKTTSLPPGTYSGSSGFKTGHMEVNSLYSGDSGSLTVNSMNAPNNSTLQVYLKEMFTKIKGVTIIQ